MRHSEWKEKNSLEIWRKVVMHPSTALRFNVFFYLVYEDQLEEFV